MWHRFQATWPHTTPSKISNLQYKPNIINKLPISFNHEDGLFLQLQINIFLKYIQQKYIYVQFLQYVLTRCQYK